VKFFFPVFALILFCKICIAEEDFRTWTSSDGRKIQAKFVEMVGDSVKIKNTQGGEFVLPLTKLSKADQEYVTKLNYIVKSAFDMELVWCPPGSFLMGKVGHNHSVILTKGFYFGKYEVTQEQYEKVMGKNTSSYKGKNLPVENVSWDDAVAFCKALTRRERVLKGWEFTLPTEAQWEYACRAGTTTDYSWGDDRRSRTQLKNYTGSLLIKTKAVGSHRPNPWGFYDMHGNVDEWTADWLGEYPTSSVTDPIGVASGSLRVFRGGRSAKRWADSGSSSSYNLGFRVSLQKQ
jgi:formylglycine-generating enzyme required for sulfatase activity